MLDDGDTTHVDETYIEHEMHTLTDIVAHQYRRIAPVSYRNQVLFDINRWYNSYSFISRSISTIVQMRVDLAPPAMAHLQA
jgi:hypothetical protein